MPVSTLTYEDFVPHLVRKVPGIESLYEAHIRDFGEVLPHVFMGDLTRHVLGTFSSRLKRSNREIEACASILANLEEAMASSDERLRELVSVSFLETLESYFAGYRAVRSALGPQLLGRLRAYERS